MENYWSFEISLRLGEHGWTCLDLWHEKEHREYVFTHIFDSPLETIADMLIRIAKGNFPVEATLHDEPGSYHWVVNERKERHLIDVCISKHKENFELTSTPLDEYRFSVSKWFLVDSFVSEFEKIERQMKHKYFKKTRDGSAVPWTTVLELKQLLKNNANLSSHTTPASAPL